MKNKEIENYNPPLTLSRAYGSGGCTLGMAAVTKQKMIPAHKKEYVPLIRQIKSSGPGFWEQVKTFSP